MLITGTFVHAPTLGSLQILKDCLLVVGDDGIIHHFAPLHSCKSQSILSHSSPEQVLKLPPGSFVLPTFCDLHLHAPQYMYHGNGLDLPLMQWLDQYAFKAEERIDTDIALAWRVYRQLAKRLIEYGTGAVMLFGTINVEANIILAEVMQTAGLRAFVGKLSMDISTRPTYVEQSTQSALLSAESFVQRCQRLAKRLPPHQRLVEPVLTPRFVPTCSNELLEGLGKLSHKYSVRVQSHLAEARDQVDWVRQERGVEDIDVFSQFNLLTPHTLQAHCTFLSSSDLSRLHATETAIAHCPLSNVYFSTEPFKLREALEKRVKVGLGTDIAGGYTPCMMNAMRQAVIVSRMRESAKVALDDDGRTEKGLAVDWKETLYLATRGGAIALDLPRDTGVFAIGSPFDAQEIKVYEPETRTGVGPLDFFDDPDGIDEDMIEKWWCVGDIRNRNRVWVQGKQLK
ncbi:hypothetical protein AMATHDRAFT_137793 [Amanita thiersii Skay4041]|uniref:Amidohydrolase-related domain-containing protein n=1 Tax=Amanita thiersii Skay4041 TaxID=703135 RepID=A0A2A9NZD4_9AGAR|nr:hypothetical protein AMATHDRAFT_137793 [Amanita thiersii Skay4041]